MSKPQSVRAVPISASNSKANTRLYKYLIHLVEGADLPVKQAAEFFRELTGPNANPAQIAGSLAALAAKGETFEEIAGMLQAMIASAIKITTRHTNFISISGTGASLTKTFNVSTGAAFVAAGAGVPVAKNTGRAVTSRTGGAEVLDELGVDVSVAPKVSQACLDAAGICFLFFPTFHPAMLRVKDISHGLGVGTLLNLLEALANPAGAHKQLVGVWHPSLVEPVAKSIALLKTEQAWVVHGSDGLDEITLAGETFVAEVRGDKIKHFTITPEDFGLVRTEIGHLNVESPSESAKIIREVFANKRRDGARGLVVLNAAASLIISGIAKDPMKAARLAEQSIDSGSAQLKLERLIQTSKSK